jgi:outer membrane receptor protein involved in Fe transport
VSYSTSHTDLHSDESIKTSIYNPLGAVDSLLVSDANANISSAYQSANLFFKQMLDSTGKQLLINGDWFTYQDDRLRNFNNNTYLTHGEINAPSFAEYLSASAQQMNIYTLKADVDLPYKYFKVSIGGKLSFIHNQSDVAFYQKLAGEYLADNSQINHFDYTENTQALYGTLNKTRNKWTFQLGLRGEYTQTSGISQNNKQQNSYVQLFPTAFATYQLDQKNLFSFSYGRRINRPNYKKLNPFRWYSNQYAYMEGNPFLKPSYSTNLELSHTYASMLSTSLSFSQRTDGYSDINFTETSSTLQVLRPENFIKSTSYQYSNSLALSPQAWWQSNTQLSIFYLKSKSSLTQTAALLEGTGAYFSTSNQFYLNTGKTIAADLSFWYQFKGIDGIQQLERQYNVDLGLKVMLLRKKLQIALNQNDLFKTNRYRYSSTINGITQQYDNYYDARQMKLSLRYTFGNDRIKGSSRKTGNEEERKRSN